VSIPLTVSALPTAPAIYAAAKLRLAAPDVTAKLNAVISEAHAVGGPAGRRRLLKAFIYVDPSTGSAFVMTGFELFISHSAFPTSRPSSTPSSLPTFSPTSKPSKAGIRFVFPFTVTAQTIAWLLVAAYVCAGCLVSTACWRVLLFPLLKRSKTAQRAYKALCCVDFFQERKMRKKAAEEERKRRKKAEAALRSSFFSCWPFHRGAGRVAASAADDDVSHTSSISTKTLGDDAYAVEARGEDDAMPPSTPLSKSKPSSRDFQEEPLLDSFVLGVKDEPSPGKNRFSLSLLLSTPLCLFGATLPSPLRSRVYATTGENAEELKEDEAEDREEAKEEAEEEGGRDIESGFGRGLLPPPSAPVARSVTTMSSGAPFRYEQERDEEREAAPESINPPTTKIDENYPPMLEDQERPPDPPIFFISVDFLREKGYIPRFPRGLEAFDDAQAGLGEEDSDDEQQQQQFGLGTGRGRLSARKIRKQLGLYDAATYSSVLRDGLVLYVSHDWTALPPPERDEDGTTDAAGDEEDAIASTPRWPLHPRHPLAQPTEHFELLLAAIDRTKEAFCGGEVGKVFLWIDFACTPLHLAPADNDLYAPSPAANMLDRVMEKCDLLLTVVHESEASVTAWSDAAVISSTGSIFQDYRSPPFQRYLRRRWARLEMLYAAHVPLPPDTPSAAAAGASSTSLDLRRSKKRRSGKSRSPSRTTTVAAAAAAPPSTPTVEEDVEAEAEAKAEAEVSHPPPTRDPALEREPEPEPEPEPAMPATPQQKPHGLLPPLFQEGREEKLYNAADLAHTPKCRLNPLQVQQGSVRSSRRRGGEGGPREERLRGGVQFEAFFGRRAHLLFGRRELLAGMPPIVLPPLTDAVRDRDLNPVGSIDSSGGGEVTFLFPDNSARIQNLLVRLMPFRHKGAAGFMGDKINVGTLSVPLWLRHGQGQMSWPNGNQYRGAWSNDRMEGKGTFRSATVGWYSGEFKFGLQHGRGRWVGIGGETYEGEWELGLRHGQGVYTWADGARFEGVWVRDEIGDYGVLTSASGAIYRGSFSGGFKSGHGSMLWPTGERYVGGWRENKRAGLGFYRAAPSKQSKTAVTTYYTGQWRDGHKYGAGSITLRDGQTLHGVFLKDNIVRPRDTWEEPGAAYGPDGLEWVERSNVSPYVAESRKTLDLQKHENEEEDEEEDDDDGIVSAFKAQFVKNVGI